MTKHYMQFECFKDLILEEVDSTETDKNAEDTSAKTSAANKPNKAKEKEDMKNIYWQGGIFWGINYDVGESMLKTEADSDSDTEKNLTNYIRHHDRSAREKAANSLLGTIVFYIAFLNDKLFKDQFQIVNNFINVKIKSFFRNETLEQYHAKLDDNTTQFNSLEQVTDYYEHNDKYKLYKISGKFILSLQPDEDETDKAKDEIRNERKQKIYSKVNDNVSTFVKENGLYTQAKLSLNDSTGFLSAIDWVKQMVKNPSSFSGYNKMLGNKKQIANMGWNEYLSSAAASSATGFLGALLTKGVMTALYKTKLKNKDKNDPKWKDDFKEIKLDRNDGGAKSIDMKNYIDNFKDKLKVQFKKSNFGNNEVFMNDDTTLAVSQLVDPINTNIEFSIIDKDTNEVLDSKNIKFIIESKKRVYNNLLWKK